MAGAQQPVPEADEKNKKKQTLELLGDKKGALPDSPATEDTDEPGVREFPDSPATETDVENSCENNDNTVHSLTLTQTPSPPPFTYKGSYEATAGSYSNSADMSEGQVDVRRLTIDRDMDVGVAELGGRAKCSATSLLSASGS